jgi:predicted metal-dependent phosphoesterase TrpH
MIDLHVHSTASDGTLSPVELVAAAERIGLAAIALTDHDTMDGLQAFQAAGRARAVRAIPGVEISCGWYNRSLHLLGLFVDPGAAGLNHLLQRVRQGRVTRNHEILAVLRRLGMPVSWEEVAAAAGDGVIGRPHIARVLVRRGCCRSVREAFELWLGKGKKAYVRRYRPQPKETIDAIHAAGGVTVWAHALSGQPVAPAKLRQVVRHLQRVGLDALETCYSDYQPEHEVLAAAIAREFGLLPSGGSDFHGQDMPEIALGRGRGNLAVPDEFLTDLETRAETYIHR